MSEDFPKLRTLDLVPIQASGKQMVALRDPLGLTEQTVVVDDQITIRPMMSLSLAFDHRLVDGAPAARFLQRVKHLIQSPSEA